MSNLIKKVKTQSGDAQIDYKALANLPTSDKTLTQEGQAADAKEVGDRLSELSDTIGDLKASEVTGISAELTGALRVYFTNVQTILPQIAYVTEDNIGNTLIQNAKDVVTILGGGEVVEPDEPIEPTVTLSSISATYTGGEVIVGTELTALTGITVTGTYSDGTTSAITGYTLSGEIAEGLNTITVSYGGKTTTFTVTGVAESGGDIEPLYGVYWQPSPTQPWNNANLETNGFVYSGNGGEYIDAGFPSACAVKINEKLQGHIYIRTLTKSQHSIDDAYKIYVNDDGELSTGGFTQLTHTKHYKFNEVEETIDVDGTTYYFTMYEWTIPSDKVGIFISAANPMTNGQFISADKISIDADYQQYYTLFDTDPTDRITEGATEVNA